MADLLTIIHKIKPHRISPSCAQLHAFWTYIFICVCITRLLFHTDMTHVDEAHLTERWWTICYTVKLLWPSDAICRHRSGSTVAQENDCCVTAPNHYLKQCWLLISLFLWHSPGNDFAGSAQAISLHNEFEIYTDNYIHISQGPIS